ncbi:MAG: hypothetical protein R3Y58_01885 [Eubacteriales bacterium]
MHKFNLKPKLHNRFVAQVIDSRTGEVKQTAIAENIVLNNMYTAGSDYTINRCMVGDGSGTLVETRTALFNPLQTATDITVVSREFNFPTSILTLLFTFDLPSEDQELTEVGLQGYYYSTIWGTQLSLLTHAFFQDAEGNPITLSRSKYDSLIITSIVYCTITSEMENFYFHHASTNGLASMINGRKAFGSSYVTPAIYLSSRYNSNYVREDSPGVSGITYTNGDYCGITASGTGYSATNKAVSFAAETVDNTQANYGYANSIVIPYVGCKQIKTGDFPQYRLAAIAVGNGDGVTTDFDCPIPRFVEDTDIITVDGVVMERGVDYTINPWGNDTRIVSAAQFLDDTNTAPDMNRMHYYAYNLKYESYYSTANYHPLAPIVAAQLNGLEDYTDGTANTDYWYCHFDYGKEVTLNWWIVTIASRTYSFLECSNDGVTWETIVTCASSTSSQSNTLFEFEDTTARYWRVRASCTTSSTSYGSGNGLANKGVLGYYEPSIKFISPPAIDALITISAEVDRPYKTEDYIIEMSAELTL